MRKNINALFITAVLAVSLSGCAGSDRESKITDADLTVKMCCWGIWKQALTSLLLQMTS